MTAIYNPDYYGNITIIKRSGDDQTKCPITKPACIFGRDEDCDIRVLVDTVSGKHCILTVEEDGKVYLRPFKSTNCTLLNGSRIYEKSLVNHNDSFTVVERHFRFEYPSTFLSNPPVDFPSLRPDLRRLKKKRASQQFDINKLFQYPIDESFLSECATTGIQIRSNLPIRLNIAKKKRVSFGPALSPEHFDNSLPPSSPLRRGSLPLCMQNSVEQQSRLNAVMPKKSENFLVTIKATNPPMNSADDRRTGNVMKQTESPAVIIEEDAESDISVELDSNHLSSAHSSKFGTSVQQEVVMPGARNSLRKSCKKNMLGSKLNLSPDIGVGKIFQNSVNQKSPLSNSLQSESPARESLCEVLWENLNQKGAVEQQSLHSSDDVICIFQQIPSTSGVSEAEKLLEKDAGKSFFNTKKHLPMQSDSEIYSVECEETSDTSLYGTKFNVKTSELSLNVSDKKLKGSCGKKRLSCGKQVHGHSRKSKSLHGGVDVGTPRRSSRLVADSRNECTVIFERTQRKSSPGAGKISSKTLMSSGVKDPEQSPLPQDKGKKLCTSTVRDTSHGNEVDFPASERRTRSSSRSREASEFQAQSSSCKKSVTPLKHKLTTPIRRKAKPLYSEVLKKGLFQKKSKTPKNICSSIRSLCSKQISSVEETELDISNFDTPAIPVELFVSPLAIPQIGKQRKGKFGKVSEQVAEGKECQFSNEDPPSFKSINTHGGKTVLCSHDSSPSECDICSSKLEPSEDFQKNVRAKQSRFRQMSALSKSCKYQLRRRVRKLHTLSLKNKRKLRKRCNKRVNLKKRKKKENIVSKSKSPALSSGSNDRNSKTLSVLHVQESELHEHQRLKFSDEHEDLEEVSSSNSIALPNTKAKKMAKSKSSEGKRLSCADKTVEHCSYSIDLTETEPVCTASTCGSRRTLSNRRGSATAPPSPDMPNQKFKTARMSAQSTVSKEELLVRLAHVLQKSNVCSEEKGKSQSYKESKDDNSKSVYPFDMLENLCQTDSSSEFEPNPGRRTRANSKTDTKTSVLLTRSSPKFCTLSSRKGKVMSDQGSEKRASQRQIAQFSPLSNDVASNTVDEGQTASDSRKQTSKQNISKFSELSENKTRVLPYRSAKKSLKNGEHRPCKEQSAFEGEASKIKSSSINSVRDFCLSNLLCGSSDENSLFSPNTSAEGINDGSEITLESLLNSPQLFTEVCLNKYFSAMNKKSKSLPIRTSGKMHMHSTTVEKQLGVNDKGVSKSYDDSSSDFIQCPMSLPSCSSTLPRTMGEKTNTSGESVVPASQSSVKTHTETSKLVTDSRMLCEKKARLLRPLHQKKHKSLPQRISKKLCGKETLESEKLVQEPEGPCGNESNLNSPFQASKSSAKHKFSSASNKGQFTLPEETVSSAVQTNAKNSDEIPKLSRTQKSNQKTLEKPVPCQSAGHMTTEVHKAKQQLRKNEITSGSLQGGSVFSCLPNAFVDGEDERSLGSAISASNVAKTKMGVQKTSRKLKALEQVNTSLTSNASLSLPDGKAKSVPKKSTRKDCQQRNLSRRSLADNSGSEGIKELYQSPLSTSPNVFNYTVLSSSASKRKYPFLSSESSSSELQPSVSEFAETQNSQRKSEVQNTPSYTTTKTFSQPCKKKEHILCVSEKKMAFTENREQKRNDNIIANLGDLFGSPNQTPSAYLATHSPMLQSVLLNGKKQRPEQTAISTPQSVVSNTKIGAEKSGEKLVGLQQMNTPFTSNASILPDGRVKSLPKRTTRKEYQEFLRQTLSRRSLESHRRLKGAMQLPQSPLSASVDDSVNHTVMSSSALKWKQPSSSELQPGIIKELAETSKSRRKNSCSIESFREFPCSSNQTYPNVFCVPNFDCQNVSMGKQVIPENSSLICQTINVEGSMETPKGGEKSRQLHPRCLSLKMSEKVLPHHKSKLSIETVTKDAVYSYGDRDRIKNISGYPFLPSYVHNAFDRSTSLPSVSLNEQSPSEVRPDEHLTKLLSSKKKKENMSVKTLLRMKRQEAQMRDSAKSSSYLAVQKDVSNSKQKPFYNQYEVDGIKRLFQSPELVSRSSNPISYAAVLPVITDNRLSITPQNFVPPLNSQSSVSYVFPSSVPEVYQLGVPKECVSSLLQRNNSADVLQLSKHNNTLEVETLRNRMSACLKSAQTHSVPLEQFVDIETGSPANPKEIEKKKLRPRQKRVPCDDTANSTCSEGNDAAVGSTPSEVEITPALIGRNHGFKQNAALEDVNFQCSSKSAEGIQCSGNREPKKAGRKPTSKTVAYTEMHTDSAVSSEVSLHDVQELPGFQSLTECDRVQRKTRSKARNKVKVVSQTEVVTSLSEVDGIMKLKKGKLPRCSITEYADMPSRNTRSAVSLKVSRKSASQKKFQKSFAARRISSVLANALRSQKTKLSYLKNHSGRIKTKQLKSGCKTGEELVVDKISNLTVYDFDKEGEASTPEDTSGVPSMSTRGRGKQTENYESVNGMVNSSKTEGKKVVVKCSGKSSKKRGILMRNLKKSLLNNSEESNVKNVAMVSSEVESYQEKISAELISSNGSVETLIPDIDKREFSDIAVSVKRAMKGKRTQSYTLLKDVTLAKVKKKQPARGIKIIEIVDKGNEKHGQDKLNGVTSTSKIERRRKKRGVEEAETENEDIKKTKQKRKRVQQKALGGEEFENIDNTFITVTKQAEKRVKNVEKVVEPPGAISSITMCARKQIKGKKSTNLRKILQQNEDSEPDQDFSKSTEHQAAAKNEIIPAKGRKSHKFVGYALRSRRNPVTSGLEEKKGYGKGPKDVKISVETLKPSMKKSENRVTRARMKEDSHLC